MSRRRRALEAAQRRAAVTTANNPNPEPTAEPAPQPTAQGFSPYGICSDLACVVRAVRALRLDRPERADNFATAASLILMDLGFNDLAASIASRPTAQQDAEPTPDPDPAP